MLENGGIEVCTIEAAGLNSRCLKGLGFFLRANGTADTREPMTVKLDELEGGIAQAEDEQVHEIVEP
jgi:hypothetical protein